jgi:hypothetical protein
MKPKKPYWEMKTEELAEATKEFDNPDYNPSALKQTPAQRARWRRWQKRRQARQRLTVLLDKRLVERADNFAATHGKTVSELIAEALRERLKRKIA